jgi:hypothetical protein
MIDQKLIEFLDTECSELDSLAYEIQSIEFSEDKPEFYAIVKVKYRKNDIDVRFRIKNNELQIEMAEGIWYNVREFDHTVKYFWMIVSPALFPIGE